MSDTKVTDIDELEAGAPVEAPKPARNKQITAKEAGIGSKRQKIMIHKGEGDLGKLPVDVFVNGMGYTIKRGVAVEVPEEVVDVLKNAVMTEYENGEAIEVPRFPFSIMG